MVNVSDTTVPTFDRPDTICFGAVSCRYYSPLITNVSDIHGTSVVGMNLYVCDL